MDLWCVYMYIYLLHHRNECYFQLCQFMTPKPQSINPHIMLTIHAAGIILCMRPANGRRHYIVTSSLIGWAHFTKCCLMLWCCSLFVLSFRPPSMQHHCVLFVLWGQLSCWITRFICCATMVPLAAEFRGCLPLLPWRWFVDMVGWPLAIVS